MLAYLELVELANGDIVVQESDSQDEPMVLFRFSAKAREGMGDRILPVVRAMIQAGMEAAMGPDAELDPDAEDELQAELIEPYKTVH